MSTPDVSPFSAPVSGNQATRSIRIYSFSHLLPQWASEIRARARKRATPWCSAENLEQAGLIALWNVTRGFRPDRGVFEHYARRAISRSMERARRRSAPLAHIRPEFMSIDDEHLQNVGHFSDPLDDTHAVWEWIRTLPRPLAQIFELLYRQGFTQSDAAAVMSLSQGRVSQLHGELLARGRVELVDLVA